MWIYESLNHCKVMKAEACRVRQADSLKAHSKPRTFNSFETLSFIYLMIWEMKNCQSWNVLCCKSWFDMLSYI